MSDENIKQLRTSLASQAECTPGEAGALSQSLKANKKNHFWLHKRYRVHISCLCIPTVANRVRIIYLGIRFTELFRNMSQPYTLRGHFVTRQSEICFILQIASLIRRF